MPPGGRKSLLKGASFDRNTKEAAGSWTEARLSGEALNRQSDRVSQFPGAVQIRSSPDPALPEIQRERRTLCASPAFSCCYWLRCW